MYIMRECHREFTDYNRFLHLHTRTLNGRTIELASTMNSPSGPSAAAVVATPPPPPAVSAGTMTLASILTVASIVLLLAVFAGVLFSLQHFFNAADRRAASGRRRRGRGTTAAGNGGNRARRGGVDPELLRSLPVTVYRAPAKHDPSTEDDAKVNCAVCLAELEDGEAARFLPRCGHGFHAECVDMWLASHSTCPLCRLTVAKPPALATVLPPLLPEPANYVADLPASVLLGVSVASDGGARRPSTGAAGVLVIEIPESAPRDVTKSPGPGSARLRLIRKLWSFGRQGAASSSACYCAGSNEGAAVQQSVSVTIADMPRPSEATAGTIRPGAIV